MVDVIRTKYIINMVMMVKFIILPVWKYLMVNIFTNLATAQIKHVMNQQMKLIEVFILQNLIGREDVQLRLIVKIP